jgi:hypothetical protein
MVRKSPNPGQLEVLRWIADGCPAGVMTGFTYKTTAVALQNRHLAKVSRRGGWHAVLTDDGRYYLEHGAYPDAPPMPGPPTESGQGKPRQAKGAVRKTTPLKAEATSGIAAESTGIDSSSPSLLADSRPVKVDVPVPSQLRDAHPVIAALRDTAGHFELAPLVRNRALRILQGLATAAEREGYQGPRAGAWCMKLPAPSFRA